MAIYLVQHGKSLPKDKDPQKGLSSEGISDVQRIAQVAANYRIPVSRIQHSGKKRALQTAEILAAELNPPEGIQAIKGINPLDDVEPFSRQIDMQSNTMIVGHLPFLEKLVSYLIIKKDSPTIFKMQNGGIVCLDYDPNGEQILIKWALMPTIP